MVDPTDAGPTDAVPTAIATDPVPAPVAVPHCYRCGIRQAVLDGRVALRLIHDDTGQTPGGLHAPELDVVLPAHHTCDVIPGDLVELYVRKV